MIVQAFFFDRTLEAMGLGDNDGKSMTSGIPHYYFESCLTQGSIFLLDEPLFFQ